MGSKILLADDSITIQKVVNLTFLDEGIEVVAVSNGDVAERKLDEVKPDLVLADIFMPGKNGYELCEAIKQHPIYRNVPVVLLVGAFEPFDQAEARRVRADAHLTKPFESRTLVETVRRLINASSHTTGGPVAAMTPADEPHDDNGSERDVGSISSIAAISSISPIPGRLSSPPTTKLDLSAMMADTSAHSAAPTRATGELSSRASDLRTDSFEISVADAQARETVTATLIDTDEPFETMEFSSSEFTSSPASGATQPILDFERSELFESPAHLDAISFETETGAVLEVDLNPTLSDAQGFDPKSIGTQVLDMPSGEAVWEKGADASQASPQTANFEMTVEEAFETPGESAGSSILAAEEPLGNLLDDTSPVEQLPVGDTSSEDCLNLELTELETAATDPVTTPTQFDLIDTPEAISSQEASVGEGQADHQTPSRSTDWTSPRAGAYSTAQLDSVVMPIETAAYLAQYPVTDSAQSEASQEASFATPAQWTEEEARFSAIDIEAVPVAEPDARGDSYVPAEALPRVEQPVSSATEPANGTSATSELSAAAIEEIVRRVIAEMSNSVVREVAWEVVPDCVERVVDQLTRESLAKST
jgi:CheY-like chemotaxis protein